MVGNDIVDIKETKRSSSKTSDSKTIGWERPGFIDKLFTPKEQGLITASKDKFTTVWKMWSMKESAYKVFIQAGGERFFNPRKIECSLEDLENGKVKIDSLILKTKTRINENYIFSTSTSSNSEIETSIFKLPENDIHQQSVFIRQELIKDFSKINNLDADDLEIRKTESGVPLLYFKDEVLNVSISMTHHGKFGGYSFEFYSKEIILKTI
ncbi:4-phosphopantetheinyl transferase family protein [Brumimicrobium glaciale]|uniref:4-phosphopantetheinyl transferase family protein n=1 Tax=Brumimicrobium glaciale TaxID=200475 RepID=A0A4Q4KQK6_9FLAO|nr:4'-phosphopantetheinyl transferase superfamily protein [Brumimicrobium glaciale]RYM35868.1 4-phosphopantetheinyl transferase family protein [Brumimicrobium glaciale]